MKEHTCEHSGVTFPVKDENKWISVKDKIPDKTLSVLIFNGSFIDIGAYITDDHFITEKGAVLDVTHWMPLPAAPVVEDE